VEFDLLTDKLQKTYNATDESWDSREVAHSSHVNLHWLGTIDEPILLPIILNNKWEDVVTCDLPIYPKIVREFFKTLRFLTEGEPSIIFMWKGRNHCLSVRELGEFFNCHTEGISPYAPYDCLTTQQQNELLEFVNAKRGTPEGSSVQLEFKHLDPNSKVLAEFIRRFLVPKGEGRATCPSKTTIILLALQKGQKVSFPHLFIKHCFWVKKVEETHLLPYGSLITRIFNHRNLNLEGEEIAPNKLWTWDERLLTKMRIKLEGNHYAFIKDEPSRPPTPTPKQTQQPTTSHTEERGEGSTLQQSMDAILKKLDETNNLIKTLAHIQLCAINWHLPCDTPELQEERIQKTMRLMRHSHHILTKDNPKPPTPPPNQ
jgi:hypothetical protein